MSGLSLWLMRVVLAGVVAFAGICYGRGRRQLAQNPALLAGRRTQRRPSTLFFTVGLLLLLGTVLPPIGSLSLQYFHLRVTRHILLSTLTPCLIMLADPLPALWWGLPQSGRQRLADRWSDWARLVSGRGVGLTVAVATSLIWFDPALDGWGRENAGIYALETLTLLGGGLLYWRHLTQAAPYLQPPLPAIPQVVYAAAGALPIKVVGLSFMFAESVLYPYPTLSLGGLPLTPLKSIHLAGAIIWMLGGVAYTYTAAYFMRHWLDAEERKPAQPTSLWDNPDAMMAPGFDK